MKKINYRHIISIMITLSFLMLSIFVFPNALGRLIEGGRDIALSVAFYFIQIFGITSNIKPTVTELPKIQNNQLQRLNLKLLILSIFF